jgi:hypothetical protein
MLGSADAILVIAGDCKARTAGMGAMYPTDFSFPDRQLDAWSKVHKAVEGGRKARGGGGKDASHWAELVGTKKVRALLPPSLHSPHSGSPAPLWPTLQWEGLPLPRKRVTIGPPPPPPLTHTSADLLRHDQNGRAFSHSTRECGSGKRCETCCSCKQGV